MEQPHPPLSRRSIVEHTIVALAVLAAGLDFRGLYSTWAFAAAPLLATVAATTVGVVARWSRGTASASLLASAVALIVLGTALVDASVMPASLAHFLGDSARSWRLALDTAVPLSASKNGLLVPLLSTWFAAAAAAELTGRTRSTLLPLVPPAALLADSANRDVGNGDFAGKRAAYRESRFELTKRIAAEHAEWSPESISRRQATLAKYAAATWRIDQLS